MNITIQRKELSAALNRIAPAVGGGKCFPILQTAHIRCLHADSSIITLTANVLDLAISTTAECTAEEAGAVALPFTRLRKILAALPEEDGDTIRLQQAPRGGPVTLTTCEPSGAGVTSHIIPMDAAEFPQPPQPDAAKCAEFTTTEKELQFSLATLLGAASTDESRHVLNGIHITASGHTATFEATDGRRLAQIALTDNNGIRGASPAADFILPSAAARAAASLLAGDTICNLAADHTTFSLTCKAVAISGRLIAGKFPDTAKVIPNTKKAAAAALDREAFADLVCRAAGMEKEPHLRLTLSQDGTATVQWSAGGVGDWQETRRCITTARDFTVTVAAPYLTFLASLTSPELTLHFTDSASPLVFTSPKDHLTYVLMPLRTTD